MFNRIKEKEVLYNLLFSYPGVMIITGSQDTGKTRLIESEATDLGHRSLSVAAYEHA